MKPAKRKAIIIAAVCVAAGILLSFTALAALDFNFFELSTMGAASNTYVFPDAFPFANITVRGAECDVRLLPSGDGDCTVVCNETDRITHTVTVENDTLIIKRTDDRKWFEHIGIMWNYWGPIEVLVYLPERIYENLYIETVSGAVEVPDDFSFSKADVDGVSGDIHFMAAVRGDLSIQNVSGGIRVDSIDVAGAFTCENVSGKQTVSHVTCQSATISSISGGVSLSDLIASESIRAESVSGHLDLTRCDAGTLWLKTVSGSVIGTLCTEKVFAASTTSGNIRVPDTATGGRCEVETVSGNINLGIVSYPAVASAVPG